MTESELDNLELQIDDLIKVFQQTTTENNELKKKLDHLNQKLTVVTAQNHKAAEILKKTIKQLQEKLCQTQKKRV